MRILVVLTYYRPHTSGLTIYAERLIKALVKRGHKVTVLTSHFDPATAREEVVDGVHIRRAPVLARVGKGVIMPQFGLIAVNLIKAHDVIHLHLPQFDAVTAAIMGFLLRKPMVITYHCDLLLPPGLVNRIVNLGMSIVNHVTAIFAKRIVAYTHDFSEHSSFLSNYKNKLNIIQPPVELPEASISEIRSFANDNETDGFFPIIGMASRFASEKGVEILLDALPKVLEKYPNVKVLFAGTYQGVKGEEAYFNRLYPIIKPYQDISQWQFLGNLTAQQMAAFYRNLDVLVLPSLNSTESFGLVQIEAMISGTPCIASALPGVRQPILQHGMGEVIPIGDSAKLAQAIIDIADKKEKYIFDPEPIKAHYQPNQVAKAYEDLFDSLLSK
jgi:glycosyltransferase involved in cell wall biosynthesis